MSKYLFVNVPAHGHVNPTLAVVQELVARGEQVVYYLSEEFRAVIEATGAEFHAYELQQMKEFMAAPKLPLPLFLASISGDVADSLLEPIRAEQADILVYDMMCFWGKILAQILDIRAVLMSPTYLNMREMSKLMNMFGGSGAERQGKQGEVGEPGEPSMVSAGAIRSGMNIPPAFFADADEHLEAMYRRYNLPAMKLQDLLKREEDLMMSFIPRSFQPGGTQLDARYYFAGPSIHTRFDSYGFPLERLSGQDVLYISLGTVFNNQVDFFNTCIAAFKDSPQQVVIAYGKRIDSAALDSLPDNFIAFPHVPQLEILPHVSVFISHGGMNSTMESLYNGVPLVVIPQMIEQNMTAHRVEELGLGIMLAHDNVSVDSLRSAVAHVKENEAIREHVRAMRQEIRNCGGYKGATDKLIEYAQQH